MVSKQATLLPFALLLFSTPSLAFWRMSCLLGGSPLVVERADPIVNPGLVSGHVHSIVGGSNFGLTETYAQATKAKCTTCPPKMDNSNYWAPPMYFHHKNGSFISVHQFDHTVYYLQRYSPGSTKLKAFPPNFRMLAGTPTLRSFNSSSLEQRAVSFVCLDYSSSSPQTDSMPTRNCPNGVRAQIFFPSCWDGKNVDSADHKSHMAYPDGMDSGKCPSSHPVRLISIFFEVDFSVGDFNSMRGQAMNKTQPFVFSMGDPYGWGFHGDFLNGWDVNVLQKAVDTCTDDSGMVEKCAVFGKLNDGSTQCHKTPDVNEKVLGVLPALPGCNPVTYTAGPAKTCTAKTPALFKKPVVYANSTIPPPGSELPAGSTQTVLKSGKYAYQSCYTDGLNGAPRTLPNSLTVSGGMTVEKCLAACGAKNYKYCGIEWAQECYGGNTLNGGSTASYGDCNMGCQGNSLEYCGAGNRLSLYLKS